MVGHRKKKTTRDLAAKKAKNRRKRLPREDHMKPHRGRAGAPKTRDERGALPSSSLGETNRHRRSCGGRGQRGSEGRFPTGEGKKKKKNAYQRGMGEPLRCEASATRETEKPKKKKRKGPKHKNHLISTGQHKCQRKFPTCRGINRPPRGRDRRKKGGKVEKRTENNGKRLRTEVKTGSGEGKWVGVG